jgi:L-asparaginase / beta-aspartyl-peptidase
MPNPTIIVHGGAGAIHDDIWREFLDGAHAAALAGQVVLDAGDSALDAVIAAVLYMENHELFNAGVGSNLDRDGNVECDALVMNDAYGIGAVAAVSGVRHPVLLARAVLEHTPHHLLAGAGATRFACEQGLELMDPAAMVVPYRRERWEHMLKHGHTYASDPELAAGKAVRAKHEPAPPGASSPVRDGSGDTVGACAMDATGRLAVASSTGGIMLKLPGRAGDTPVAGAGSYCGPAGAVTCTGHGESAMQVCLAKYAYDLLERGASAREAADAAVAYLLERVNGHAGLIVLDRQGRRAWNTSTHRIAVGLPAALAGANSGSLG